MKDITFKDNKLRICPICNIPVSLKGWKIKNKFGSFGTVFFFLFHPQSWIIGYTFKCDKCKHIFLLEIKEGNKEGEGE